MDLPYSLKSGENGQNGFERMPTGFYTYVRIFGQHDLNSGSTTQIQSVFWFAPGIVAKQV